MNRLPLLLLLSSCVTQGVVDAVQSDLDASFALTPTTDATLCSVDRSLRLSGTIHESYAGLDIDIEVIVGDAKPESFIVQPTEQGTWVLPRPLQLPCAADAESCTLDIDVTAITPDVVRGEAIQTHAVALVELPDDRSGGYVDADRDGVGAGPNVLACGDLVDTSDDCDDSDPDRFPGNPEVCDGIDNDCQNGVDDGLVQNWYADADTDGHGDPATATDTCAPPTGYVLDADDCDDTRDDVYTGAEELCDGIDNDCQNGVDDGLPTTPYYLDADGDSFGDDSTAPIDACSVDVLPPGTYVLVAGDCDDTLDHVNPDGTEVCGPGPGFLENGIDEDCDGDIDNDDVSLTGAPTYYLDRDEDGFFDGTALSQCGTPSVPSQQTPPVTPDCNDDDNTENPADYDGDGFTTCTDTGLYPNGGDCNDDVLFGALQAPDLPEDPGNDIDDDCNGALDCYTDADRDGFGTTNVEYDVLDAALACSDPGDVFADLPTDCDDNDPSAFPGGTELVANGIDEDCDGNISCFLDGDDDGYSPYDAGSPQTTQVSLALATNGCDTTGLGITSMPTPGHDCDDTDDAFHPGANDFPTNDDDEDCDSLYTCFLDGDGDTFGDTATNTFPDTCTNTTGAATNPDDCNDADNAIHPGATETDGNDTDEDCDGDFLCFGDLDGDGHDALASALVTGSCSSNALGIVPGDDCDDTPGTGADIFPGNAVLCDGVDNDCDPASPDEYAALDGASVPGATLEDQLAQALADAASGSTVELCNAQTYSGSFFLDTPITLLGNDSVLDGGHFPPDHTLCSGNGKAPVLVVDTVEDTTYLQDLTVLGACTDDTLYQRGGGMLVQGTSIVEATNMALRLNAASFGGGLAVTDTATVQWLSGTMNTNDASSGGGAWVGNSAGLLLGDGVSPFVIDGNSAEDGGAVYATGTVDFVDSTLSNNMATSNGGAVYATGTVSFDQVKLSNNTAANGNTIFLTGAGADFTYTIAPSGNGDDLPNIYCSATPASFGTDVSYAYCDRFGCY